LAEPVLFDKVNAAPALLQATAAALMLGAHAAGTLAPMRNVTALAGHFNPEAL
jgi:hypothetical protein